MLLPGRLLSKQRSKRTKCSYIAIHGNRRRLDSSRRHSAARANLRSTLRPVSLILEKKVKSEALLKKRKPPTYKIKVQNTIGKKVALSTWGMLDLRRERTIYLVRGKAKSRKRAGLSLLVN